MKYLSVKDAAAKWGYSENTIRKWCRQEKIQITFCAVKKNGRWQIPSDAICPGKQKVKLLSK